MAELASTLPALFAHAPLRLAVAYSGGADSTCLLHLAHDWAKRHGTPIIACHVHHGLSPHADDWLAHCQQTAALLGISFAFERIHLEGAANLEARARAARYAALARMCGAHQATLLLTAHHQQDQAETVLLQWMRGAQPATGMESASQIRPLPASPALWLARPLLNCPRPLLLAHLAQLSPLPVQPGQPGHPADHQARHVEDASNLDPRFARNALRHQVLPQLAQIFPAADELLARQARHGQTTRRLLLALAEQDLARLIGSDAARAALGGTPGTTATITAKSTAEPTTEPAAALPLASSTAASLPLAVLTEFDAERAQNILRHWLEAHGLRLPSSAWLAEAMKQLQQAREDAQLCVRHPLAEIYRYRDRIYLTSPALPEAEPQTFHWHGEAELPFPAFGGSLQLVTPAPGAPGFDSAWLRQQTLQIHHRQGGERLKLAANRPTRSLKQHYQAHDVPGWLRARLPLVSLLPATQSSSPDRPQSIRIHQPELLFAAGIGSACQYLKAADAAVQRVNFQWQITSQFK